MATSTAIAAGHELPRRARGSGRRLHHPWALALAVAIPLATFYLIVSPPAGDLAAATYRSDLFARAGFTTWDTGWYAAHGHWLPGYSLLSPALGALLGVRVLLVLSGVAASVLFALIARRAFDPVAARIAAVVFALGFSVELLSGRVPYDLGFAIGLATVLALMRGALPLALGLAAFTSVASPVAGAFLALAGLAGALGRVGVLGRVPVKTGDTRARAYVRTRALTAGGWDTKQSNSSSAAGGWGIRQNNSSRAATDRGASRCLMLTAAALLPILTLSAAYPEGGYEPFAPSDFWLTLGGVLAIALLLPQGPLSAQGRRIVRVGAALYALALIGSFAIQTPVGGNAARLGPPLAAPLLAGVLWERRRVALLALAPVVLYWQLITPIHDAGALAGDPSVSASYYAPVRSELRRLLADRPIGGAPIIVEVPLTKAHWEAVYLAGHDGISLARGWERQLDTRYGAIFYRPSLSSSAYRAWLAENRVAYVALPDAPLDQAGLLEGKLVARGLPYLRELWRSEHWRVYRAMG